MNKKLWIVFSLLIIISISCFADEIVTTKDGKQVRLKDDKTWEYVSPTPSPTPSPAVSPQATEMDDGAKQIVAMFKEWGNQVLAKNYSEIEYITINPASYEQIHPNDPRNPYRGADSETRITKKVIAAKGTVVWQKKAVSLFIANALTPSYDHDAYRIYIGESKYDEIYRINPKLSENLISSYFSWNDTSSCPLKILAYKLFIDKYKIVQIGLIIKNTSSKPIVGYAGTFLMYDKMGNPVTWGGGANSFGFLSQDDTIPALSPITEDGYWALRLYENTRRITPYIREVQFGDGTKWIRK